MDFSENTIFEIIQSTDLFPIDFQDAWQWIGYSTKGNAKVAFEAAGFLTGIDFRVFMINHKNPKGGRPTQKLSLTVDCFKSWAMMAGTEKGREVRRYFLACEAELKRKLEAESQVSRVPKIKDYVLDKALSWNTTQTGERPFIPEFYEHLYRIRGGDGAKRNPKLGQKPGCVGTWTNQLVYDLFPGAVPKALNEQYKSQEGTYRKYEFLTKIPGRSHLLLHMASLLTVMRVSPDENWSRFLANVQKAFPNPDDISAIQLEFDFLLGMEEEWAKSQR
jgi:phage anti-repressor protein